MIIGFFDPSEENGYLSSWYPSHFTFSGKDFSLMGQYMMYRKAMCFRDTETASRIMKTRDIDEIKRLGRLVSDYDDRVWSGVRQIAAYEGALKKFSQNGKLKEKLLATGNAVLAECSETDKIWGIGLSVTDPDRCDPDKWTGSNLLGFTLMMVRRKLRE
ncbi:MAG: NADAR family protein [Clostridia bacterium]|nr:NADAR family protein [Clostridia bacterium]